MITEPTGFGDHDHGTHWVWRLGSQEPNGFGDHDHGTHCVCVENLKHLLGLVIMITKPTGFGD